MKPFVHRRLRLPPLITLAVLPFAAYISYRLGNEWFFIPFAAIVAYHVWSATLLVRVDPEGILLRRSRTSGSYRDMRVPWISIDEVTLSLTEPPDLTIRLKPDAPLPDGVRGAIHDPTTDSVTVGELQRPVPGIDALELEGALERFGRRRLTRTS